MNSRERPQDSSRTVCVTVDSLQSLHNEERIRGLVSLLRSEVPEYLPDIVRIPLGRSPLDIRSRNLGPLSDDTIQRMLTATTDWWLNHVELAQRRPGNAKILLHFGIGRSPSRPYDFAMLCLPRSVDPELKSRGRLIELASRAFETCSGFYGTIGTGRSQKWTTDDKGLKSSVPTDFSKGLPPPQWATFLGQDYVDLIGLERLKRAPCYRSTELPSGGVLIVLSESLQQFESDPLRAEEKRRALEDHIGHEWFAYIEPGEPKRILQQLALPRQR
jgi:hypothetical protein